MTLNATNLKEEIYIVCTTIYFGYLPTANMTWLTVEPQTAHVVTPTKTPEQSQQEAEQAGWLNIWHEFTWWYPWYRLHVEVNINPYVEREYM